MRNYTIDINTLNGYIRYLKDYQRDTERERRNIGRKIDAAHANWIDENYDLTVEAMEKIDEQLQRLSTSLEETIKSLQLMTDKYDNYLNRRRK